MGDQFVGEIRSFAFPFAPSQWAQCNGSILPVNQNQALYSLILNKFGGTTGTTFALPDLRGRAARSPENSQLNSGQMLGSEAVNLTINNFQPHNHGVKVSLSQATSVPPTNGYLAGAKSTGGSTFTVYLPGNAWSPNAVLNSDTIQPTGSNVPRPNMQPFAVVNYCIAIKGVYPTRW